MEEQEEEEGRRGGRKEEEQEEEGVEKVVHRRAREGGRGCVGGTTALSPQLDSTRAVPPFSSSTANGVLSIKTSALSLSYSVGSPFTASTLSIATSTPPASVWHYGDVDSGNLFGTIRSLDMVDTIDLNCTEIAWITVYNESLHCEFGLVSQLGWAVFVDNRSALLDANDWPSNDPSADDVDLYFFGHGFDFRAALADYVLVGGPVPMLPRYAHGVMWSRWYDISTYDVKQIVDAYESRAIPLDIFIMDMDCTWQMSAEFSVKGFRGVCGARGIV